ncbi:phosphoglycolate phosphatase [Natronospira proteinivora]|uniref:Phosphoglycolate phosphatase n=1 Tax=Natronospira proteinivora TaxID=1807133 RepID=A0ABT1G8S8_9GAMM|nr:HAD-IA family hydrolase [Natronospira proteinivora]MCP1726713.1 phosphoglycolate phosphatase [Natronospira proteinivora]
MKLEQLQLVIFDWDGTLMDSTGHIVASIQAAAQDLGLSPPSEAKARSVIGLSLDRALSTAMPGLSPETARAFALAYRERYLAEDRDEGALYPGAGALLDQLDAAGLWSAVATGKGRVGLDRAMREMGVEARFVVTRCADESRSKPHPQMLEDILTFTGLEATQALMVGDTSYDLDMARALNMPAVAVCEGAHEPKRLRESRPMALLDHVGQLADWLGI